MAKYFVQSGTMRCVVQAQSSRKAAIWAVHQAMQQVLPMDDPCGVTPESKTEKAAHSGVSVLSTRVTISERGFDRNDGTSVATLDIVSEWNQLVTTLDRLERMLYREA